MKHLCNTANVPALSSSSPKLLAHLQSEELSLKELVDCLKLDPCLGARLLHLANSPFYGISRKVVSVGEAVIVLGLKQTRALVQVEVMRSTLGAFTWNIVPLQTFWHQSLAMAAHAQVLAHRLGLPESNAFTAGLVHNLGMLILAQHNPQQYAGLMVKQLCGQQLAMAERTLFKMDHGLVGAELLRTWNLPDQLCLAIEQQYLKTSGAVDDVLLMVLKTAHCFLSSASWTELQVNTPKQLLDCCDVSEQSYAALAIEASTTTQGWLSLAGEF